MSKNNRSTLMTEYKEYIAERIMSISFLLMPKSDTKSSFAKWIIQHYKPTELPSDEEIDKMSQEYYVNAWTITAFKDGAKWTRNKIRGGNNEQQKTHPNSRYYQSKCR
ncbi:MAG: hypothetical protein ACOVNU_02735 [Candidatus Kapaibacteriota bacterium]